MITFKQRGDFSKTERFFKRVHSGFLKGLDDYGKRGVEALRAATPVDSGKTVNSWYYKIEKSRDRVTIGFYNSNENKGQNIAILLQYGHGTGGGGYVVGRDYINPAIRPVFDELAADAWKEVKDA